MNLNQKAINRRIDQAAAALLEKHGLGQIEPESLKEIGKKFGLPIGDDVNTDVVARTIVIAASAPEAREALEKGRVAVKERLNRHFFAA